MLAISGVITALFLAGQGLSPATGRPQGVAPCTISQSLSFADYLSSIRSLEQLIESSTIIVDAVVLSNVQGVTSNRSETGVLLQATDVLKGPKTLQQFAISRMDARGDFLLLPGQRFILFLTDESQIRLQLMPQPPGVPIFLNVHLGTFCVDKGVILLEDNHILRSRIEGAKVEKVTDDIRAYVGLRRVDGSIRVEGGAFPPAGLMTGVPPTMRDDRNAFKVVATPAEPNAAGSPATMAVDAQLRLKMDTLGSQMRLATIDGKGVFQLPLAAGAYRVKVEGLPFGYYVKSISSGAVDVEREPLRVSAEAAADLRIVLTTNPPGSAPAVARVSGRVTGLTTALDLGRVRVTMQSAPGMSDVRSTSAQLASDGRFEFQSVPTGRYVLRVAPPTGNSIGLIWSIPSELEINVAGRDLAIELPLFGGVEVKGRFVDRNGNPANVNPGFVLFSPDTPLDRNTLGNPGAAPSNRYEVRALTDGTFTIWLPAGEYTIIPSLFGSVPGGARPTATKAISGSIDLLKAPLKIDGKTPVDPLVVTVE